MQSIQAPRRITAPHRRRSDSKSRPGAPSTSLPLRGAQSRRHRAEGHRNSRQQRTPNTNAHVDALTRSIQPQRGKIDFPEADRPRHPASPTSTATASTCGSISPYPVTFVYAAPPEVAHDSCHMVTTHRRDRRRTPRPADRHGQRSARRIPGVGHAPRLRPHGRGEEHQPSTASNCAPMSGRGSSRAPGSEDFSSPASRARRVMYCIRSAQPRRAHRGSSFPTPSDVRSIPRCASGTSFSMATHTLSRLESTSLMAAITFRALGRLDHAFAHREDSVLTVEKKPSEVSEEALVRHGGARRARPEASDRFLGHRSHHARHGLSIRRRGPDPVGFLGRIKGVGRRHRTRRQGNATRLVGLQPSGVEGLATISAAHVSCPRPP